MTANRLNRPPQRFPRLTCIVCKKRKVATKFTKLGGPYYEDYPTTDPRRYGKKCKMCDRSVPPGVDRSKLKEPINQKYQQANKDRAKRQRAKERAEKRAAHVPMTSAERKRKTKTATRIKSMTYLAEHGCEECNERDPRKLEYDHNDPADKSANISRLVSDGYSWSAPVLRAEILKCRVLCANCHRVHTVRQQGYLSDPDSKDALRKLAGRYGFSAD